MDRSRISKTYDPEQHVEYKDGKKMSLNNGNKSLEASYNPKQHVEYKDGEKITRIYNLKNLKDLCILCEKSPMNIQNKEDLLGLIKKEVLHCPNCGAEFEMNNDKYKLINFNDKNNNIWIKYHEKSLYEEEWLNIICGGISNEEKKKINEEKEKELKRNKIKVEEERRKNQEREKQKRIEEQKRKNQEIERQRIVEEERKKQQIAEERKKEEVINRNNRSPSHEFQNYTITGARLDEPRSIRRNLGSSAPFLFKRTRIYYSQSESHDEWRTISFGDITVKETGVFFVGEMASRKFDRKKILDVSLHKFMAGLIFKKEEWGIRINVENRQKPSIITLGSEELALELVNKIINAYNI